MMSELLQSFLSWVADDLFTTTISFVIAQSVVTSLQTRDEARRPSLHLPSGERALYSDWAHRVGFERSKGSLHVSETQLVFAPRGRGRAWSAPLSAVLGVERAPGFHLVNDRIVVRLADGQDETFAVSSSAGWIDAIGPLL